MGISFEGAEDGDYGGMYESVERVANMLNHGSKFFTLGMRFFYISIPV